MSEVQLPLHDIWSVISPIYMCFICLFTQYFLVICSHFSINHCKAFCTWLLNWIWWFGCWNGPDFVVLFISRNFCTLFYSSNDGPSNLLKLWVIHWILAPPRKGWWQFGMHVDFSINGYNYTFTLYIMHFSLQRNQILRIYYLLTFEYLLITRVISIVNFTRDES